MPNPNKLELEAGLRDSMTVFPLIKAKFPDAFPENIRDIRPLKLNIANEIAENLGMSYHFVRGVLRHYVMSARYCRAVLRHNERVGLDGRPNGEPIDEAARSLARVRLARIRERRERQARETKPAPPKIATAA